jgi:hypothetical protein
MIEHAAIETTETIAIHESSHDQPTDGSRNFGRQ